MNFVSLFEPEKMFGAQKVTQMCKEHQIYRNSTTNWRFYTFFELIPLYTNLFSLHRTLIPGLDTIQSLNKKNDNFLSKFHL